MKERRGKEKRQMVIEVNTLSEEERKAALEELLELEFEAVVNDLKESSV